MNQKETPVLLLTGYLGSGKTTLLNRVLGNREGIRFAVIVNDIGEVNIDADLIQKGGVVNTQDDSLIALQNGCICCTLQMDLVEQISGIIAQQCFDYIVIEASGVCEPEPIARTLCSIPAMEARYTEHGVPRLDSIVTVVDALRMRDEFGSGQKLLNRHLDEDDIEKLVIQQIEFCNIILLNKVSEVAPDELERIRVLIRTLQPHAEILECDYGRVPLGKLLYTDLFDFDRTATSAKWIEAIEGSVPEEEEEHHHHDHHHGEDDEDHDHHGHHHHHHHGEGETGEYGIGTFVWQRREPMDMGRFDEFVARHWPEGVIRAKGICYFHGEYDTCYVFEQAGRQVSLRNAGAWYATMPEEELEMMFLRDEALRRDWDEVYGDRMQKLVFIGQHMDRRAITEALDACLRKG